MTMHATCVAVAGHGVLIIGPSGSGKSALALQLMAAGAVLVADDRTLVSRLGDRICAAPPRAIAGMIEARGVGILSVKHRERAEIAVVIDMATLEVARLPEGHSATVLDIALPCLHKVDAPHFPAAIHAYVSAIRKEIS